MMIFHSYVKLPEGTHSNHSLLHVFRVPTCWPVFFGTPLSGDVRGEMSHSAGRWTKMMKRRSSSVCPRVLCHPWVHDILKVASRQKHPRTWGSDWDLLRWLFGMNKSIILEFLHHTCPIMVMPQGLLIVCGRLGLMTYIHFSVYWLFQVETCVWGVWKNCKHDSCEALAD